VIVPVLTPPGTFMPLLITSDGSIEFTTVRFARNLILHGTLTISVEQHISTIGRLYDFYVATVLQRGRIINTDDLPLIVLEYVEARKHGTIQPDGTDLLELWWEPVSEHTALTELGHISTYSAFCESQLRHGTMNAVEEHFSATFGISDYFKKKSTTARKTYSLLRHLDTGEYFNERYFDSPIYVRRDGKGERSTEHVLPEHFPIKYIEALIHETKSLRNMMIWILLIYGGIRISEALNLFDSDITYENGMAHVRLAHPVNSPGSWVDDNEKVINGTREQYLRAKFGRIPRNKLPKNHPQRAGWKGMNFDGDARRLTAIGKRRKLEGSVFWLCREAGEYFWELHTQYMALRSLCCGKHPYYFVNFEGEKRGEPLTEKNIVRCFEAIARKVGSEVTNIHSLRHLFGVLAVNHLRKEDGTRFTQKEVQVMMHHASPTSTEVYAKIDPKILKASLDSARLDAGNQLPAPWLATLKQVTGPAQLFSEKKK
jgi:integrase